MIRSRSSITSVANRLKTGSSASVEVGRSGAEGEITGGLLELGRDWFVSKRLIRDRSSVFSDSRRDTLASSWELTWAGVLSCQQKIKISPKNSPDRHSLEKNCMSLDHKSHIFSVYSAISLSNPS